jgi:hypothetical protein
MCVLVCKKIIGIAAVFFMIPLFVFAQSLTITPNPKHPQPGDRVNFILESFGVDLSNSQVTWKKNGEVVSSGQSNIFFSDIIPQDSSKYSLTAQTTGNEGFFTKTYSVSPFNVDLMWEVQDGYTPPFYKGKTLPVRQSNILFHAVADSISPGSVSFEWSHRGQSNSFNNGKGRNTFSVINDPLYTVETVSVVARSVGSSAQELTQIQLKSPEILFYETSNSGVRDIQALGENSVLRGRNVSITAIPYFLTVAGISDPNFDLFWEINGSTAGVQSPRNILNLRNLVEDNRTNISVAIDHKNRLHQDGEVDIEITLDPNE